MSSITEVSDPVEIKSIFASKTFWLNAITTAVTVTGALLDLPYVKANPQVVLYLGAAVSILNILARIITVGPVALPKVTVTLK